LPPEAEDGGPADVPPATVRAPRREKETWSAGWGSWPSESEALEELAAESVLEEEDAGELVALQERLPAPEIPEAARVTVPVVSLEQLEVDRAAEHLRFHRRTAPAPPPPARREPHPGTLPRSRAELRRAI